MKPSLPISFSQDGQPSVRANCESSFSTSGRSVSGTVPAGAARWPAPSQLHLDFHTSPHIPDIAAEFDAGRFAKRLRRAGVGSVTLFAKCHHSMCYYPTRVGVPHPGLPIAGGGEAMDLLGQQIEACHARDILCPVYVTVGWSEGDAARRPEWRVYDRSGLPVYSAGAKADTMEGPNGARPHVAWSYLDVGDGSEDSYGYHVIQLIDELCDRYPLDGLFLDICTPMANFGMPNRAGTTVVAEEDAGGLARATAQARHRWLAWAHRVDRLLHSKHPRASLFFNGLAEADTPSDFLALQTHLEVEDLPSFWGGYDQFPIRARCLAGRPEVARKPFVAMSGRFHTMWGEFGGYKHPEALRMEAVIMAANACRCSFGDQLPPSGKLDEEALTRLTPAMGAARSLEAYVDRARFVSSLAIWHAHRDGDAHPRSRPKDQIPGLGRALMEMHREFIVLSPEDFQCRADACSAIMVAEAIPDEAAARSITAFVESGGRVLLIGPAAIESAIAWEIDCGVTLPQRETFDVDYITPTARLTALAPGTGFDTSHSPVLCYEAGIPLTVTTAEVLAEVRDPYFSRTVSRFCSHRHSPPDPASVPRPAITTNAVGMGSIYCLAHAWGGMYQQWGMRLHRDLLGLVLKHADPLPTVEASLPSAARISLLRQDHLSRHVLHVTYAPPIKRGCVEVLEDFPELSRVSVTLNLGRMPRRVWAIDQPERALASSSVGDGRIRIELGAFRGHAAIVLND